MVKRQFIKITLRQGESINRNSLDRYACLLVLKGRVIVFNNQGKMMFSLSAGEVNLFDGHRELTGTAVVDTELIIV